MSEDKIDPEAVIAEAEAHLKDITPGTWAADPDSLFVHTDDETPPITPVARCWLEEDRDFIAAAPRLTRQLLSALTEARAALAQLGRDKTNLLIDGARWERRALEGEATLAEKERQVFDEPRHRNKMCELLGVSHAMSNWDVEEHLECLVKQAKETKAALARAEERIKELENK